jgi:hypothetical protein
VLSWLLPEDAPVEDLSANDVLQLVWYTLPVKWGPESIDAPSSSPEAELRFGHRLVVDHVHRRIGHTAVDACGGEINDVRWRAGWSLLRRSVRPHAETPAGGARLRDRTKGLGCRDAVATAIPSTQLDVYWGGLDASFDMPAV